MKIILNFAKWKYKASFFIVIFSSCDNGLQAALDCADNNCKELEKVIEYFEDKGDKIALSAAEFIIENMSGHKSMYSCYADYYDEVDSLFSMGLSADDAYGVINKVSDSYGNTIGYDYDSHIISSEYLIKDIEAALSQWKQGQWATHLDFNEFCEWLLPYTCSSSQPLDNWRADLDPFAKGYIDELYVCDDYTANPRAAICRVNNNHDSILTEMGVVVEAFQLNKRIEWRIREF